MRSLYIFISMYPCLEVLYNCDGMTVGVESMGFKARGGEPRIVAAAQVSHLPEPRPSDSTPREQGSICRRTKGLCVRFLYV